MSVTFKTTQSVTKGDVDDFLVALLCADVEEFAISESKPSSSVLK